MAIYEKDCLMSNKDANGNTTLLYPITRADCVDSLDDAIAEQIDSHELITIDLIDAICGSDVGGDGGGTTGDASGASIALHNADSTAHPDIRELLSQHTSEINNLKNGIGVTPGEDGVGIASIIQTTTSPADGGVNVVTVTLTNGSTSTFEVRNGSKGSTGEKGNTGEKGEKGDKGDKGDTGEKGEDGYTPVKGTDYFTNADKTELINAVLASLPIYNGEVESV